MLKNNTMGILTFYWDTETYKQIVRKIYSYESDLVDKRECYRGGIN